MDKKQLLKKASNMAIGTYPTAGFMSIGAAVEHLMSGGKLEDIPEKMRETVIQHLSESAPTSKNESDLMEVGSGLAALTTATGAAGHATDFAASLLRPESEEERSRKAVRKELGIDESEEEPESYEVAQSGLKKRLTKGGPQADFARIDSMKRNRYSPNIDRGTNVKSLNEKHLFKPLSQETRKQRGSYDKYEKAHEGIDFEQRILNYLDKENAKNLQEGKESLDVMGMSSGVESGKPSTETGSIWKKESKPVVEKEVKPKQLTKKQVQFLDDAATGNYVFGTQWNPKDNVNMYGSKRKDIKDVLSKSEFDSLSVNNPIEKSGYIIELVPVDTYGNRKQVPPIGFEYERSSFIRVRKKNP